MDRRAYMREYQRQRRAADPERASAEVQRAYARRLEAEAADPALLEQRQRKAAEWREAHRDRLAIQSREWYAAQLATPETAARLRAANRRHRMAYLGNPKSEAKTRARWRASRALRDGRIQRQPCEACGAHAQMHHPDYSRPLDVRWLCRAHHEAEHHRR